MVLTPGSGPSKSADKQRDTMPSGTDALKKQLSVMENRAVSMITSNPDVLKSKLIEKKDLVDKYKPLKDREGQLVAFKSLSDLKRPGNPAGKYMNNVLKGEYVIYKSEKHGFVVCEPKNAPRLRIEEEEKSTQE